MPVQAASLGLGTQWAAVKTAYAEANELCGNIVKVTPSSKVVGDFAQYMVANNLRKRDVEEQADKLDFPVRGRPHTCLSALTSSQSSVVEFFQVRAAEQRNPRR
jgi:hypothetical protein